MRRWQFPPEMFTVLFAIGRTPGWLAQWSELVRTRSRRSPGPSRSTPASAPATSSRSTSASRRPQSGAVGRPRLLPVDSPRSRIRSSRADASTVTGSSPGAYGWPAVTAGSAVCPRSEAPTVEPVVPRRRATPTPGKRRIWIARRRGRGDPARRRPGSWSGGSPAGTAAATSTQRTVTVTEQTDQGHRRHHRHRRAEAAGRPVLRQQRHRHLGQGGRRRQGRARARSSPRSTTTNCRPISTPPRPTTRRPRTTSRPRRTTPAPPTTS